jgi:carboxyl-terminal processing protease
MKNLFKNTFGPLIMTIVLVIGIVIGSLVGGNDETFSIEKLKPADQKVQKLIKYINSDYIDNVNTDSILDVAINNILVNLDPHSTYIPASESQAIQENMNGSFVGIGVEFRIFRDTVLVVNILEGGPSQRFGLQNGDRILKADNDTLYGKQISSDYAMSLLKGESGTAVNLEIYRPSSKEIIYKDLVRGKVPIKSVDASYVIYNEIGYIKINRFSATTFNEFSNALDDVIEKGAESLIIDLRGNPGGYMHAAKLISSEFLEKNTLIVYTKDKNGILDQSFADGKGRFQQGDVFVLIDEKSASASEVVAGALQDNDRAQIVGRRSFGKGLVQQELNLGDGSKVRLTTARYYTPTGRSIQKPYSNDRKAYMSDYISRIHSGELIDADSIKIDSSLVYKTPKGKKVYGGGGIVPDLFVPVDTTSYKNWVYSAFRYLPLCEPLFDYADANRIKFREIGFDAYLANFDVNDKVYPLFLDAFSNTGFKYDDSKLENDLLRDRVKAYLAKLIWSDEQMYQIWDANDDMINKVKLFNSK